MTTSTGSERGGLWIAIDGPAGTGKSTTAALLADIFEASGDRVHATQLPSRSPFGQYVRHAIATLDGYPLACVLAADRYAQVHDEITPALAAGKTVISDRYVASIALDVMRGVPADVLWHMHAALPRPDLAVILETNDCISATRVRQRGPHSRWQAKTGNAEREKTTYGLITTALDQAGWSLLALNTTSVPAQEAAETIARHYASRSRSPDL